MKARRRLVVWAVVIALALLAHFLLARRLAAQDPIAEVLLGRAGSVLPLAGIVLLLRLALFIVLPVAVAMAVAQRFIGTRS